MWVLPPENRRLPARPACAHAGPKRGDDEEGVATELGLAGVRSSKSGAIAENVTFRVITFPGIQGIDPRASIQGVDPGRRSRSVDPGPSMQVRRISTQPPRRTSLRYRIAANRSHAGDADRPLFTAEIRNLLMNEARSGTRTSGFASSRFLPARPSKPRGHVHATQRASCGIE
jgi:hypothetical protein